MITKTKTATDLNNFYKFLNIDPLSFNGMYLSCMQQDSLCGDDSIWTAYDMPLSREKLAELVRMAEQNIETELGTPVKAKWIREEIEIPSVWFNSKIKKPVWDILFQASKRFIKRVGQQRLERILEDVGISFTDEDNDGFDELATITFTLPVDEQVCDIKLYFPDTEHEITGFEILSYDEETRETVVVIDSWLLVKPELYFKRSFIRNSPAIDGCSDDSFVLTVDIWIDAVDTCKPSVEIVYPDGHICNGICTDSKQPGCMTVVNSCEGTFKVVPQSYDDDGCVQAGSALICGLPTKIIVYYQAGCHTTSCLDSCNDSCFCADLEDIVFKLAASRYPYPNCDCPCISSVLKTYSQQTSLIVRNEGRTFRYSDKYTDQAIFGTTVGEIEAAIALNNIKDKFCNYE